MASNISAVANSQSMKNKLSGLEAYKSKIKKLIEIEKECIRDLHQNYENSLLSPKRKSTKSKGTTNGSKG